VSFRGHCIKHKLHPPFSYASQAPPPPPGGIVAIYIFHTKAGAIIGDGNRKSWDPRAPMIWDKFSIFRTNCAIVTSYIRADPCTCRGLLRGCCHVAWSNGESWETLRDYLAYFSRRRQGIRQGIRTRALICSFMFWANGKGGFFRVENKTSIARWEWIVRSARASCKLTRMFLRLFWLTNIARKLSTLVSS